MDPTRGTLALVLTEVRWFTGLLDTIRTLDREILDPRLVAAMDSLCEEALALRVRDEAYWSDPQRVRVGAVSGVRAVARFREAWEAIAPEGATRAREDPSRSSPEAVLEELRQARLDAELEG